MKRKSKSKKNRSVHVSLIAKHSSLFWEITLGLIVIIVFTLLFLGITKNALYESNIVQLDTDISHFMYSLRTPLFTKVMIVTSLFGADLLLAFSAVIGIFLFWEKHKKESLLFFFILFSGLICNLLLKEIFRRPRPTMDPLLTLTSYSFPSGHAMNSFVFYATIAYFIYHFTRKTTTGVLALFICAGIIFLIGLSRVYLGVHYPSDVAAGYAAGMVWFVLVLLVDRIIILLNYKSQTIR